MPVLTPQTDGDHRLGFSISGVGCYDTMTLSVHSCIWLSSQAPPLFKVVSQKAVSLQYDADCSGCMQDVRYCLLVVLVSVAGWVLA